MSKDTFVEKCQQAWKSLSHQQTQVALHAFQQLARLARDGSQQAEALHGMGIALHQSNRLPEALQALQAALRISPQAVEIHNSLGNVFQDLRQNLDAQKSYQHALQIYPAYATAWFNLGNVYRKTLEPQQAQQAYRQAVSLQPDYLRAWLALADLMLEQGQGPEAFACYHAALPYTAANPDLRRSLLKKLAEGLCQSYEPPAFEQMLKQDLEPLLQLLLETEDLNSQNLLQAPLIYAFLHQKLTTEQSLALMQNQSAQDAWHHPLIQKSVQWPLLQKILSQTVLLDDSLENYLTQLRQLVLQLALAEPSKLNESANSEAWLLAMARQCWNNEYVFVISPEEEVDLSRLRETLAPELILPILVCLQYVPLQTLNLPVAKLQELALRSQDWGSLLQTQLKEPERERLLAAALPSLTVIQDPLSLAVQNQYECNPYPRWLKLEAAPAMSFNTYWQQKFPGLPMPGGEVQILVIGCGTGAEALGMAQSLPQTQILALDLSRRSLAYAQRMAEDLQISNIRFAQADLLEMIRQGSGWPLIICSGVLHHLANPWQGWESLLELLAPGGIMKIGLYSRQARTLIQEVRTWIQTQGWATDPAGIRSCRQALLDLPEEHPWAEIRAYGDFYSMSACRDLLFHVQEQNISLSEIADFNLKHALNWLGFEASPWSGLRNRLYQARFGRVPHPGTLQEWSQLEQDYPDIFLDMYQFWCRK